MLNPRCINRKLWEDELKCLTIQSIKPTGVRQRCFRKRSVLFDPEKQLTIVYFTIFVSDGVSPTAMGVQLSQSVAKYCSNALPFTLVHFPKGEYPGKLTQREIISEEDLSEH